MLRAGVEGRENKRETECVEKKKKKRSAKSKLGVITKNWLDEKLLTRTPKKDWEVVVNDN